MEGHGHDNATLVPAFVAWVQFSTTTTTPVSYAFLTHHATMMWVHVVTMLLATLVLLPAALLMERRRIRLVWWTGTSVLSLAGVGLAALHRRDTKDLYENAFHRKFGVFLVVLILARTTHVCYRALVGRKRTLSTDFERLPQDVIGGGGGGGGGEEESAQSSTACGCTTPRDDSFSSMDDLGDRADFTHHEEGLKIQTSLWDRMRGTVGAVSTTMMMVMVYAQILLGIATYGGLFTNHEIFNGLAHWIKASIFLLFGIWVLMRYLGFGSRLGHAWNHATTGTHRRVSAESIECGLIFTYGVSNLFLERLGHAAEPVSHTDIQHMSIAAMFACAGFVGLLLESRVIRDLLRRAEQGGGRATTTTTTTTAKRGRIGATTNVMPALVVFFTGLLMSQHAQDSAFTTDLHRTWGYYFCIASLLRVLTYCLTYLAAPSPMASRPPSEVLVSFSLIAGAIVFMMSARDPAQALEYYGIDLMFAISLSVAGALVIMVWTMYLMILRGLGADPG